MFDSEAYRYAAGLLFGTHVEFAVQVDFTRTPVNRKMLNENKVEVPSPFSSTATVRSAGFAQLFITTKIRVIEELIKVIKVDL